MCSRTIVLVTIKRLDESCGDRERHIPEISVIQTFSADGEGEFGSRRPFLRVLMRED